MKPTVASGSDKASTDLTELERDALAELANVGVSRAASSLRKMVGQQILLSVPSVEVVSKRTAALLLEQREGSELVAVRQAFSGCFSGRALMIFPQKESLELVRVVVDKELGSNSDGMAEEALAEIGNVILNGCLGTIANMLQQPLDLTIPEVFKGSGTQLFEVDASPASDGGLVLFLYINFSIRELNIRGYIAMLMDLPALVKLKVLLGDFIARVMDEEVEVDAVFKE
jgi:chemotaxis protein CheC